jgi:hypothetical protein
MATNHRTSLHRLRALAIAALIVASGCSIAGPSPAPPLQSIRYVRIHPVKFPASQYGVSLAYSLPMLGDPYGRSQMGSVSLRQVDANTFVYDRPGTFMDLPSDTECTFWVLDAEVSRNEVARTIYVNGTAIRVESMTSAIDGQPMELGRFKIAEDGRIY